MTRARLTSAAIAALLCVVAGTPAHAAVGKIFSFAPTSSGSITFTVADLSNAALPGSQPFGFALMIRTSALPGSVTVTAPAMTGTLGNTIAQSAFLASCVATSDPGGIFTSSGMVRLSSGAVTCGTVAANANNTINFDLTLYLDTTDDASAFTADTYAGGTATVTANAP